MKNKNILTYKNTLWARKKGFLSWTLKHRMKAQSNTTVVCHVLFKHWKLLKMMVANMMNYFGIYISQITYAELRNTQYMWNTLEIRISFSKSPKSYFQEPDPVAAWCAEADRTVGCQWKVWPCMWYGFPCCTLPPFLSCYLWSWCGHWAQIIMVPTIFIWPC